MKQRLAIIFAVLVVLSLVTINVFAASQENRVNYADQNNDGICDNAQSEEICPQDGTGKRNGAGTGFGSGMGFVDSNGSGVCKNNPESNAAQYGKKHKNQ